MVNLMFALKDVNLNFGRVFSGSFNLGIINENITFDGTADITIPRLAKGSGDLKLSEEGLVTWKARLETEQIKNVTGSAEVEWMVKRYQARVRLLMLVKNFPEK